MIFDSFPFCIHRPKVQEKLQSDISHEPPPSTSKFQRLLALSRQSPISGSPSCVSVSRLIDPSSPVASSELSSLAESASASSSTAASAASSSCSSSVSQYCSTFPSWMTVADLEALPDEEFMTLPLLDDFKKLYDVNSKGENDILAVSCSMGFLYSTTGTHFDSFFSVMRLFLT